MIEYEIAVYMIVHTSKLFCSIGVHNTRRSATPKRGLFPQTMSFVTPLRIFLDCFQSKICHAGRQWKGRNGRNDLKIDRF